MKHKRKLHLKCKEVYLEVRRSGERGGHRGRESLVCGGIRRRFGEKSHRGAVREKGVITENED